MAIPARPREGRQRVSVSRSDTPCIESDTRVSWLFQRLGPVDRVSIDIFPT
jgi:hypothetical protein